MTVRLLEPGPAGPDIVEGPAAVLRLAVGDGVSVGFLAPLPPQVATTSRWLLNLDTETGTPAEAIYERWGWQRYGHLEDHAARPDGVLAPTTFFVKRLREAR
jgi:acetyltransferase